GLKFYRTTSARVEHPLARRWPGMACPQIGRALNVEANLATRNQEPGTRNQELRTDQPSDHVSRHIGEPEIASLESIRQPFVVKTEQMQQSRMQVMNMDWIAHDIPAQFVRFPKDLAAPNSAARQPQTKRKRMMVAAGDGRVAF